MANETVLVGGALGDAVINQIASIAPAIQTAPPLAVFGVLALLAIILSQVVGIVLKFFIGVLTSKTTTEADDIILTSIQQPIAWLVFSGLIYIAFARLSFSPGLALIVRGLLLSFNIAMVAWLLHRLSTSVFHVWQHHFAKKTDSVLDDTMLPIISKFIIVAIWVIAFLIALSAWGIEVGPFIAGLGIAGIAIGFAIQDSLGNIFGGISLALDGAYKIGDKVRLGDGTVGTVYDISLRSTQIKTYDGDLVMVPNGKVANQDIYTYAQPARESRVQVDFGVAYGTDVDKVKKVALKAINKIDIQDQPEPSCLFMDMGESALEMRVYFWVSDYAKGFSAKREAVEAIYKALTKENINIPYPTRTIHLIK